jgi:hypothetical protein
MYLKLLCTIRKIFVNEIKYKYSWQLLYAVDILNQLDKVLKFISFFRWCNFTPFDFVRLYFERSSAVSISAQHC